MCKEMWSSARGCREHATIAAVTRRHKSDMLE